MNLNASTWKLLIPAAMTIVLIAGVLFYALPGDEKMKDMNLPAHRAGPFQVQVMLDPEKPKVGKNRVTIIVHDYSGTPVSAARIRAAAEMPAMGSMPAMRAPAEVVEKSPGTYSGQFELSMDGAWPLSLDIDAGTLGHANLQFDLSTSRAGLRLTQATPGQSGGEAVHATADGGLKSGKYTIDLNVQPDPPVVGNNQIIVDVKDAQGAPVSGAQVRAVAEKSGSDGAAVKRVTVVFQETDPARYVGTLELTEAGDWPFALDVQTPALGHGDFTIDLATGRKGLKLLTATPEGISHYTCSMHPSVKSATPGTCPICGMDLVPVTNEEKASGSISMDARRRQLIGVTTGQVTRQVLTQTIRAAGKVSFDESELADISLKFGGWIDTLQANYVGVKVKAGEPLFTVYSPELVSAQEEYLEIWRRGRNKNLLAAARRRLALWDIRAGQIRALEKRGRPWERLPILAPISGTVVEKDIVAGTAIKTGQRLLRIANLDRVWVEGEVYEYELPNITTGMAAEVVLPELPDQRFDAKLTYVAPFLQPKTRTARIRVNLKNTTGLLRPDMYAHVHLKVDLGERLVVPETAVLYAGDSRVVFVDLGDGRLQPRKIKTGLRNGDYIEVLAGLKDGDTVVTSGNFLIAAESKLKAGVNQW